MALEGTGFKWRPTTNVKCGVVVYDYQPEKAIYPFLPLKFGDVVQILEENGGGWYRGFSLMDRYNRGIFPASYISIKECTVKNPGPNEVVTSIHDPTAQEISDALKEWSSAWKKSYTVDRRRWQELSSLMRDLLVSRNRILLSRDDHELNELKKIVGKKIDHGNGMLHLNSVPRDESGSPIDPKSVGIMNVYKSLRLSHPFLKTVKPKPETQDEYHLFLKFSALAMPISGPFEILFFIYDGRQSKQISERYMIALTEHCLPRDVEKINRCFSIFTDLGNYGVDNKDLYIACQICKTVNELNGKTTVNPVRTPCGAAVFPLCDVLSGDVNSEEDVQMTLYVRPDKFHYLIDSIIRKENKYQTFDKGTGVFIALTVLRGSLATQVKMEDPHLFHKFTAECHKLGFPESSNRLYDGRHDVYLTLDHGVFNKEAGLFKSNKSVEVEVAVLDEKEKIIQNCICPGVGEPFLDVYHSLVHYHSRYPTFKETIGLNISSEMMKVARVSFKMYHRSTVQLNDTERPFAIAHLKLMEDDGTVLDDGNYELFTYKWNATSRGAYKYTTLPSHHTLSVPQIVSLDLLSPGDSFHIRMQICSTKLTQNVQLHHLLHWRQNIGRLPSILAAVVGVPGDEIIKFFSETFNAIFLIIDEYMEEVGDLCFEALVSIIGLLSVEKYENFHSLFEEYHDRFFHAATVHVPILVHMKYVFKQAMLIDGTRRMRGDIIQKTYKATEFLIKLAFKSRALSKESPNTEDSDHSEEFTQSLQDLLYIICALFKLEWPENELILPRTQAQILQRLPNTFDTLLSIMSPKSLGELVAEVLNNMREGRLKIYKSVFIGEVISSELFKCRESRVVVVPAIFRHLRFHIANQDDILKKSLDMMCSILTFLHDIKEDILIDEIKMVKDMLRIILDLFFSSYNEMLQLDSTIMDTCVAVLMASLELMNTEHYLMLRTLFINSTDKDADHKLQEVIRSLCSIFLKLITELHNDDSANLDAGILRLHQNYVMLCTMRHLSKNLVEALQFSAPLWKDFFIMAVEFTCQSSLQVEMMNEVKGKRILEKYGDMRVAMNQLIVTKWQALGNFQAHFVPTMLGPFLKMSILPPTAIRVNTIQLFYDMMNVESLSMIEKGLTEGLHEYMAAGLVDDKYLAILEESNTDAGGNAMVNFITTLVHDLHNYQVPVDSNNSNFHREFLEHFKYADVDSGDGVPKGYLCVARNIVCLAYLPNAPSEKIVIKTITETDLHPKTRANEIVITPVVCINPHGLKFGPHQPAVIEIMKTVELDQNKEYKFIPLFSNTDVSEPPRWEELNCSADCKVNNDCILFHTTHFSLFTVIARIPFPSESITVEGIQDSQKSVELTIPELPQFSVKVPPTSIPSDSKVTVKATAYFNDHIVSAERDGYTLASSCLELEPHGHEFSQKIEVILPIPDYAKVIKNYPVAKLQLWHAQGRVELNIADSTPFEWELITDSDIVISQDDDGQYMATVYLNHFSWVQYMWDTVCYYTGVGSASTKAVKSIQGRCQAFMSQETPLEDSVTFSIAILVYPFRDPYPNLPNYDCVLMDSGDRALCLTLDDSGKIYFRIELMPFLSYIFPASSQGQTLFSGSLVLSQDGTNRKDFVIKADTGINLKEKMPFGQLILTQGDNTDCSDQSLSLIKPMEPEKTVSTSPCSVSLPTISLPSLTCTAVLRDTELNTVLTCSWGARCKWFNIGLALGINLGTLEAIRSDNRDQSDDCFRAMLKVWLRRAEPIPCWRALAKALRSITVGVCIKETIKGESASCESPQDEAVPLISAKSMEKAADQLKEDSKQWEDNDMVIAARRIADLMKKMASYTRNKVGMKADEVSSKEEFVCSAHLATKESEIVKKMAEMVATRCTNMRLKEQVQDAMGKIPTIANQLKIIAKGEVHKHRRDDPEADDEACRMLKDNVQNLMHAVSQVLNATDSAIIEVPCHIKKELGLQWVRCKRKRIMS